MLSCLSSPARPGTSQRLELGLRKRNSGLTVSRLRGVVRAHFVPGAFSSLHEDSVDIPDSEETMKMPDSKGGLHESGSAPAKQDIQGPTCGVDDLAIWRLIYGPGATLSYASDSDSDSPAASSPAVNLERLMRGQHHSGPMATGE